jgi:hypothetical protein
MKFVFLFGIVLDVLKRAFSDVYGSDYTPTIYGGIEYTEKLRPSTSDVYVHCCDFLYCVSNLSGGAFYCRDVIKRLLIEQSSFVSCKSGNNGGGIYFYNPWGSESVLSNICVFNCTSTYNSGLIIAGQSVYIDSDRIRNHVNDSSVAHSLKESEYAGRILNLEDGSILCFSVNLTNNEVYICSALFCNPSSSYEFNMLYGLIANNTANLGYTCIWFGISGTFYFMDACNILNNDQTSYNYAAIRSVRDSFIKDSCIIGNNKGKKVFYTDYETTTLTLFNCTIDDDIVSNTRYSGSGTINITIEGTFGNELPHIETLSCDSYIDFYVAPTASPTPDPTDIPTPDPTDIPTDLSIMQPSPNLEYTPIPTWNGEWAEEPIVIINEDDIPIIKEAHYPLQTEYFMTSVPPVTAAANISIGATIIAVIIGISVYNFLRSGQILKMLLNNGKYDIEVNSDEFLSNLSSSSNEKFISEYK